MYGCKVEIVTRSEGEESRFCADGLLEEKNGELCVFYRDGGDEVVLRAGGDCFFMERKGDCTLSANFLPQAQTELRLQFTREEGLVPIETSFYKRVVAARGYCVTLAYALCYPENPQNFKLEILIQIISEEK